MYIDPSENDNLRYRKKNWFNLEKEKEQLRNHIRNLKESYFGANEKEYYLYSKLMTKQVIIHPLYQKAQKIAYFASKKQSYEIHTDDLIHRALSEKKEVYLPRCIPESRDLELLIIQNLDKDTEIGHYSIREPKKELFLPDQEKVLQELDLLFVPGMAFYNKNGKRLGYGMGYYDKFISKLKQINPDILIIGLCFDFQIFSNPIPYTNSDSQVMCIISPTKSIWI